jgi:light-regulated signal transduction histidine kinase (bacteriophytochrome)
MTSPLIPQLQFFENYAEPVIITGEDGTILLTNPAFTLLTGLIQESVTAAKLASIVSAVNQTPPEMAFDGKDNSIITFRISQSPIIFSDESKGRVYTFSDNSALVAANHQLEELGKELNQLNAEFEQFAYAASHDLQEPLRTIASYLQLIERDIERGNTANIRDFMNYVLEGAGRMQLLINDLLLMSRVSRKGNEFAEADLNEIVQIAITHLANKIQESEAIIQVGKMPHLRIDSAQILRLFQNLIDNGVKFKSPERKPKVIISVEEKEHCYEFAVKDNGIGIESRFYDRIFVIFQRLHSRIEYEGTGVGLAVCKKIVERHGGEIWVQSEPGKGSTFYFKLKK